MVAESIIEELSVQREFREDLTLRIRMLLYLAKVRWLLSRRRKSRSQRREAAASEIKYKSVCLVRNLISQYFVKVNAKSEKIKRILFQALKVLFETKTKKLAPRPGIEPGSSG